MSNVIDYVKWRGDFTFLERSFNEMDGLVLSLLVYEDFRSIVPSPGKKEKITIADAAKKYESRHDKKQFPVILDVTANSVRFGNLSLCDYVDILVLTKEGTQFAAMHILGEGIDFIAFRGTDNSIIGWREDFSMSFEVVPAQKYAFDYLKDILDKSESKISVGGHSKGGNLSIYSTAMLELLDAEKIKQIYSYDGPGLCPDIISAENYNRIKRKLIRVIPDFSIIGMLFEQESAEYIVKSNVDGVIEHDAYTWQIEGSSFVLAEDVKEKSKVYVRT